MSYYNQDTGVYWEKIPDTIPGPLFTVERSTNADMFEQVATEARWATNYRGVPVNPYWAAGSAEPRELGSVDAITAMVKRHGAEHAPKLLLQLSGHKFREASSVFDNQPDEQREAIAQTLRELAGKPANERQRVRDALRIDGVSASASRAMSHLLDDYWAVVDAARTECYRAWDALDTTHPTWRDRANSREADARAAEFVAREGRPATTRNQETKMSDITPTSNTTTRSRDVYAAERDASGERSYLRDLFRAQVLGDADANARLAQLRAEQRAIGTSAPGLVAPQYLVDMAALIARSGRPTANTVAHFDLPVDGMSLVIPKGSTGASAAVQATENTAASNTDEVWSALTSGVVTLTGQQLLSRQLLERAPGVDQLVFADLAAAYNEQLDVQVLSGSGTSGQMLGILNTAGIGQATAFGAAVTAVNFYSKIAGQISAIATNRKLAPDTIIMSPRRYTWLMNQFDTTGRPLAVPQENGPFNADAIVDASMTGGRLFGLPIIADPNIPITTGANSEDVVIVARAKDCLLWERADRMPNELRFEQSAGGSLTTTLVAYGYAAFTAGRYPAAVGVVGGVDTVAGDGLIAPVY